MERTRPLWEDKISYELRMGRNVMVVAHANTLRGLVKIIDNIGDEDIQQVSIPTGIPIVYKFEKPTSSHTPSSELVPIISTNTDQHTQTYISGIFLGKPGVLKEALKREKEWIENVPGYSQSMNRNKTPMSPLELSLTKLAAEKELANWAGQFIDQNQMLLEDDGSDGGSMGNPQTSVLDYNNNTATNDDDPDDAGKSKDVQQHMNIEENSSVVKMLIQYDDEEDENRTIFIATPTPNMISIDNLCLVPTTEQSSSSISSSSSSTVSSPIRRDATIVLIRHGKTEHNKLGLFTGWQVRLLLFIFLQGFLFIFLQIHLSVLYCKNLFYASLPCLYVSLLL
jgi:2,3-bisphosphoglycerate-dependent phosphoglycerate mutase